MYEGSRHRQKRESGMHCEGRLPENRKDKYVKTRIQTAGI